MKHLIISILLLTIAATVSAQDKYRTDISIRDQVVHNKVPGAAYRSPAAKDKKPGNTSQQGVGSSIRDNKQEGVRYKVVNSNNAGETSAPKASEVSVASDKKAEKSEPVAIPEGPQLTQ